MDPAIGLLYRISSMINNLWPCWYFLIVKLSVKCWLTLFSVHSSHTSRNVDHCLYIPDRDDASADPRLYTWLLLPRCNPIMVGDHLCTSRWSMAPREVPPLCSGLFLCVVFTTSSLDGDFFDDPCRSDFFSKDQFLQLGDWSVLLLEQQDHRQDCPQQSLELIFCCRIEAARAELPDQALDLWAARGWNVFIFHFDCNVTSVGDFSTEVSAIAWSMEN